MVVNIVSQHGEAVLDREGTLLTVSGKASNLAWMFDHFICSGFLSHNIDVPFQFLSVPTLFELIQISNSSKRDFHDRVIRTNFLALWAFSFQRNGLPNHMNSCIDFECYTMNCMKLTSSYVNHNNGCFFCILSIFFSFSLAVHGSSQSTSQHDLNWEEEVTNRYQKSTLIFREFSRVKHNQWNHSTGLCICNQIIIVQIQ